MIDEEKRKDEAKAESKKPEPKPKKEPEKKLVFEDGTAVGAPGLGIHLIHDGKRRWVPNTFTQTKRGICMDDVVMLFPEQLLSIPEGPPVPDWAPEEPLF